MDKTKNDHKTEVSLDVNKIRKQFPILAREVHGKPLAFLDNAATSQKPDVVLKSLAEYYETLNANVHRGAYYLSQEATEAYEGVRPKVAKFIGAKKDCEVIYTRGTTEAINIVSHCWGRDNIQEGDDIVVTRMEHHSNFVPWQQLAKEKKANFKIVELTDDFRLDLDSLKEALSGKPKVLAVSLMSNVLGTLNPVAEIAKMAHDAGAIVVVDGAQAVPNRKVDLQHLDVDFFAFSSHKMCGPTGVGILWGREELLKKMSPWQYGGDMILRVEDKDTSWNELPWKFEAGTPNIADVIAFGRAIDYLEEVGMDKIAAYEAEITEYALSKLKTIPDLKIFGPQTPDNRGPALSFTLKGVHPHDLATFLDHYGIAVRAGHHCAQPLVSKFNIPATTRASFYFYNTFHEADALVSALKKAKDYFE